MDKGKEEKTRKDVNTMDNPELRPVQVAEEDEIEIDLLELFYYFLSRIRLIMCGLILGALAAGLVTHFLIPEKYTATSKLYMVSASNNSVVDLTDLNLGTTLSLDYEVLMQIRPIAEDVIDELDLDYSYESLMGMVDISSINETRILAVTVESTSPHEAMRIANAFAEMAVEYLPDLMETSAPNIAERAILPAGKSSPSMTKNTLMGAFLGMFLVTGVLTVVFLMDDTLKSSDDVEKAFGIMPLAVIPEGDLKEGREEQEEERKGTGRRRKRIRRDMLRRRWNGRKKGRRENGQGSH